MTFRTHALAPNRILTRAQDKELAAITAKYGTATYAILWGIVFAETGLVITPFLPGDSLLFACGALCALGSLNLGLTCATFLTAAICKNRPQPLLKNSLAYIACPTAAILSAVIARPPK